MNAVHRQQHITQQVDQWIAEEELPTRANLKPIRKFDGIYPEDEDERQAYFDFLHWYVSQEHIAFQAIKYGHYDRRDARTDPTSKANLNLFPQS